jgi:hypothetical protein
MILIQKFVYETLQAAATSLGLGVYRRPGADAAEKTPFVVFAVTGPTRVSNASLRHGVKFTLTLNLVTEGYDEAVRLSYRLIEVLGSRHLMAESPYHWSSLEVTSGPEDTNTSLSSSELDQMTMVLSGIVRMKNNGN